MVAWLQIVLLGTMAGGGTTRTIHDWACSMIDCSFAKFEFFHIYSIPVNNHFGLAPQPGFLLAQWLSRTRGGMVPEFCRYRFLNEVHVRQISLRHRENLLHN